MDEIHYYSYSELIRRFLALFLCVIFFFPYFYYNLPLLDLLPKDNSFFFLSKDADFNYSQTGKMNNITLRGSLKNGELQLSPKNSLGRNYQFLITTGNAVISAKDSVLSIISYLGSDGIYYTHVVCKKGHAAISLYNETESKVSSNGKYLSSGYEALVYKDQNKVGFVRFEADGTNPRPDHGVYSREIKMENGLYEYLEMDPLFFNSFLSSGRYNSPNWDYSLDLGLESETKAETENFAITTDPRDFTICFSVMYFNAVDAVPWGRRNCHGKEDIPDEKTSPTTHRDNFSVPVAHPVAHMIINDDLKTLGSEEPMYLDTLTLYENFPSHTVLITGQVFVKSLVLISAAGKDESNLIEKDPNNRVLPLSNYFKLNESGSLVCY